MKTVLYISCIEMHGIHAVLCISELYTMLIKYVAVFTYDKFCKPRYAKLF